MELLRAMEEAARARLPEPVYDFFAGGGGDEQTLRENVEAWKRVWVRPRTLVDVSVIDTSVELFGRRYALPVLLAPVAAHGLAHPDAEVGVARAATAAGTTLCVSSRSTRDLGEIAAAASAPLWFQLYVDVDRDHSAAVLGRLREFGVERVVLTVDLPVGGRRERDARHGPLTMPDGVRFTDHLGGWRDDERKPLGGWDATLTVADIAWVREASGLPVLVKGVLVGEDARAAVDAGAAGIVVSNHGGRQLDGVTPTAVALREVAEAVAGDAPVIVDGGIRDGVDVFRALALGADAVLIGRPFLWGLAAEGEAGVARVLEALRLDLELTLRLAGCPTVADVGPERVQLVGWERTFPRW
jgi:4-hydroxymandelate oxidase